ncbi:MAG TPA: hypothetical protein VG591_08250 [Burkholderiales bacterium]|jgi:acetoin utilization protein AcuC|nr:hypothetical protein [Burkholderiales bacterium]
MSSASGKPPAPATVIEGVRRLCMLAEQHAQGRLMAFGGGGCSLEGLAMPWCAVLEALQQ